MRLQGLVFSLANLHNNNLSKKGHCDCKIPVSSLLNPLMDDKYGKIIGAAGVWGKSIKTKQMSSTSLNKWWVSGFCAKGRILFTGIRIRTEL
jgi:hypothetical protein